MKAISLLRFLNKIIYYPHIIYQLLCPINIPVIIINFNQLLYLKKLVKFLLSRGFKNIIIIDNNSTYPQLLNYYDEISDKVRIEKRDSNDGHMVFFKDKKYRKEFGKGLFILTDADIVPNENLPKNFIYIMIKYLLKYYDKVDKVGFALDINSIPNTYPLKSKVLNWEAQFWSSQVDKLAYLAPIDTTFALYKPLGKHKEFKNFYSGIRLASNFTAFHGGWYLDPNNLTDENKYYMKTSNSNSSSWKFDENGNLDNEFYNQLYSEKGIN